MIREQHDFHISSKNTPGEEGGVIPHMKVVGMLVVSLRGVNFRFWSHLECMFYNVVSFRGQKKLGPHPHRSPSMV